MIRKNLYVIADYGSGDPAFAEVILRLRTLLPEPFIYPLSVPPFSTLNTGFWIYQLALTRDIDNLYIYSNTAPRKHDSNKQQNNSGEKLMYARLKNGVQVMAVNAGFVFSFIKPYIEEFAECEVANEGSQFRSRDNFPPVVAKMLLGSVPVYKVVKTDHIPDYPKDKIASIDGYGNIKTTTRLSEVKLKPGQKIKVSINNITHLATFTDGVFNINDGETAYAPGSSGHEDRFMEVFVRGGNAWQDFGKPRVEEELKVEKAD